MPRREIIKKAPEWGLIDYPSSSLYQIVKEYGLYRPFDQLNPPQRLMLGAILEATLVSYGLNFSRLSPTDLSPIKNYLGLAETDQGASVVTDLHRSYPVRITDPSFESLTPIKYVPNVPELNDVSPLVLFLDKGKPIIRVSVGDDLTWSLPIETQPMPSHAKLQFEVSDHQFRGIDIIDRCVMGSNGGFGVLSTSFVCAQHCEFCSYPQALFDPNRVDKARFVITQMVESGYRILSLTLTGGMTNKPDGGFRQYIPMLKMLNALNDQYGKQMSIRVVLEMAPWQPPADELIFQTLAPYVRAGLLQGITLNIETPAGIDRSLFMPNVKGQTPVLPNPQDSQGRRSYFTLFMALKDQFPNLTYGSLLIYGLKPPDMKWETYNALCLRTITQFAKKGVMVVLQPLRPTLDNRLNRLSPIDLRRYIELLIQAGGVYQQYNLIGQGPGCVVGCNACDATSAALRWPTQAGD